MIYPCCTIHLTNERQTCISQMYGRAGSAKSINHGCLGCYAQLVLPLLSFLLLGKRNILKKSLSGALSLEIDSQQLGFADSFVYSIVGVRQDQSSIFFSSCFLSSFTIFSRFFLSTRISVNRRPYLTCLTFSFFDGKLKT